MKSMTGWAVFREANGDFAAQVEIRGVNSRFLEVNLSVPPEFFPLEGKIRDMVKENCARGKVDLTLRVENAGGEVQLNEAVAKAWAKTAKHGVNLLHEAGVSDCSVNLTDFLALEGVVEKAGVDVAAYEPLILRALTEALDKFDSEKSREGAKTCEHIASQVSALEKNLSIIKDNAATAEELFKNTVRERFHETLGDKVNEDRVLTETAALLVKWTIAEEVSRLGAHFAAFRAGMEESACSRKLDFLSQEINREVNTIGSKSQMPAISQAIVRMKEAVENIREQLRNIE
jgi:uncharacterized protein (TIGR00255 family)